MQLLQKKLNYAFRDESLLRCALTHSSWANEHEGEPHNERLEFLGDAVLEIVISSRLFTLFPDAREGDLTRVRSSLVMEQTLAGLARNIGLDRSLRLSRGEEHQGGRHRDSLLADAMEAVFGGIFIDGGFDCAKKVIEQLYAPLWPSKLFDERRKDFKTRLQEVTQHLYKALPLYTLISSNGPEHARNFSVRVELPDGQSFESTDSGLKRAEQAAARTALEALNKKIG
ncbi:MAG: ribonuclease III [Desulfovibrionaceae bacterium]|nr:ribonuclease III [Desulfovibrionaceae bacterium]